MSDFQMKFQIQRAIFMLQSDQSPSAIMQALVAKILVDSDVYLTNQTVWSGHVHHMDQSEAVVARWALICRHLPLIVHHVTDTSHVTQLLNIMVETALRNE